jgi:glycosyltransferase involved in cell wall biosynthesis
MLTAEATATPLTKRKVIVVMPAYNASKTLKLTYADLPHDHIDGIILVDDGSKDETIRLARELGLQSLCTLQFVRRTKTILPQR